MVYVRGQMIESLQGRLLDEKKNKKKKLLFIMILY
jgi:hypothetical protein